MANDWQIIYNYKLKSTGLPWHTNDRLLASAIRSEQEHSDTVGSFKGCFTAQNNLPISSGIQMNGDKQRAWGFSELREQIAENLQSNQEIFTKTFLALLIS